MTDSPSAAPLTSTVRTRDDVLAADTSMAAVTLHVRDLALMTSYYRDAIGLGVLSDDGGTITLGRGATPLVVLRHTPDLPEPARGQAGLFHTAVLFEDAPSLAAAVASAAQHPAGTYTGSADHLVSEAFYFTDPEGNGVELYVDRPRSSWTLVDGEVQMDTVALDPRRFLTEHLPAADPDRPGDAVVGHVHLQVGDLATARRFYVDAVGFEPTLTSYPGALFVSAGGYHHHLAVNVWDSRGAGPRASTLGLGEVSIVVPGTEDVAALTDRLRHHEVPLRDDGRTLTFDDPWRNTIRVTAAA